MAAQDSLNPESRIYRLRHSLAHVLAQAVKTKFPAAKLGFGPPIDNGFYYDFDLGDAHLHESDLSEIEKIMKKIIRQRQPFARVDLDAAGALAKVKEIGDESYKAENIQNLKSRGESNFSFYSNGPFSDLCEGPHVAHTGELPEDAFKLDRIAGAYWLGSEDNKMLTRVYGLAFETRAELDDYLKRRKLAEQFDHKKLGKELEIFHQEDIVGKGLPLWLPNGTTIRNEIQKFAEEKEFLYGYKRVATPHITKEQLYVRSQHLAAYKDSMFPPMVVKDDDSDVETRYYLKPMNCPHHHLIYGSRIRSYRELPLRLAEYGTCYRYEKSGELGGLIRVRCMTMNDAHIYLTLDQFEEEFRSLMQMYMEFYDTFRLSQYSFRLSIRGAENADKFKGPPEMWDRAETMLAKVMDGLNLKYFVGEGEAAFYGPKIDIQFRNLMGREETVSTIQVDFLSPHNFDMKYIDSEGKEQVPIIIHRAPLSTHERFLSFLIEYYGGAFPTWCAPTQVCMIPVSDECNAYADQLSLDLHQQMVRVEIDKSDNSFGKKIRTNAMRKIPILLILGKKEVEDGTVTIRRYGVEQQETMTRADFVSMLQVEIRERKMLREPMAAML